MASDAIRIDGIELGEDAMGREKVIASVQIRGKAGTVTLYADGSLASEPAWLIDRAAGNRSDAKHAVRTAIRSALTA